MKHITTLLFFCLTLTSFAIGDDGAPSDVVVLTAENFDGKIGTGGIWLLEFFAPWCGHCKRLAPTYEELATKVKGKFNIAKIDCTVENGLCSRFGVRGFPTIKLYTDGKIRDYSGDRSISSFQSFLDGGFEKVEGSPLPDKSGSGSNEQITTASLYSKFFREEFVLIGLVALSLVAGLIVCFWPAEDSTPAKSE